jgi:2'-5' RNA ligase
MKKCKGGTAIMLRLPLNTEQREITSALAWKATMDWGGRKMTPPDDLHLTLQFVGRDLDRHYVCEVIKASFGIAPLTIKTRGHFLFFGTSKGRYMVMEVAKTPELITQREVTREWLRQAGLKIQDDFEWNPHITLAESNEPATVTSGMVEARLKLPDPIDPFEIQVTEVEVKYGSRRMIIDL